MKILIIISSFIVSYFFAGIPFGYIVGKIKGIDIRKSGSGNIGATNVFRVIGKKEGIFVFIMDFLKGIIPVLFFKRFGTDEGIIAFVGVFLGHTFTPYLKFKGGKGIATGFGGLVALLPLTSLSLLIIWLIVFITTGFVSLASITAAFLFPYLYIFSTYIFGDRLKISLLVLSIIISLLVIFLHRSNIKRLIKKEEHRFNIFKKRNK